MSRKVLSLAAVVSIGIGVAACGSDDTTSTDTTAATDMTATDQTAPADGITIADPWSRKPADGQTTSAVYGVVTNGTDETITAISASTSVATTVELHEVLMGTDGKMSMQEKEGGYEIAPGDSLTFEPGGAHIMLLGIDPATYPDNVEVTLNFDDDSSITFDAEVRSVDSDMDDHDMDDTDTTDDDMEMPDATDG